MIEREPIRIHPLLTLGTLSAITMLAFIVVIVMVLR